MVGEGYRASLIHTWPTFVYFNGGLVISENNGRSAEGSECLGKSVNREFAPWKAPEHTVGEGNAWVDMTAALPSSINAEHDTDSKICK